MTAESTTPEVEELRPVLEWQIADGSRTAHVIDTAKPGGRRSGPKALCGKYPQRLRTWWYGLGVNEVGVKRALASYGCIICPECDEALPDRNPYGRPEGDAQ